MDSTPDSTEGTPPVGYGAAAPLYRANGWAGVLPLPPKAKKAPPEGYTGRTAPFPDDAAVEEWRAKRPGWNLALRLPDNVVGIDVDTYGHKAGEAHLESFAVERGLPALPPTWVSTSRASTASGIRWYRVPEGGRYVDIVTADVELIQHGHRYALVWPSVSPDPPVGSGEGYVWVDPRGRRYDDGTMPTVEMLPELPEAWVEALKISDGSGGGGGRGGAGRIWSRDEVEAAVVAADAAWTGQRGSWEVSYAKVVDRMRIDGRKVPRREAMLRATAIVVGDVVKGDMPGRAVDQLEVDARHMYEDGLLGKVPEPWEGTHEADFWNQIGGAFDRYSTEGDEWNDRIADELGAREWAQEAAAEAQERPEAPVAGDGPSETPEAPEGPGDAEPEEHEPEDGDGSAFDIDAELRAWYLGVAAGEPESARVTADTKPDELAETVAALVAEPVDGGDGGRTVSVDDPNVAPILKALVDQMLADSAEVAKAARVIAADAEEFNKPVDVDKQAQVMWLDVDKELAAQLAAEALATAAALEKMNRPGDFVPEVLPHVIWGDWLPEATVATLVSPPSVGKTLVAVDMAARVAMGWPWFGVPTERCPVLFLSFEAAASTENRIAGWCQRWSAEMFSEAAEKVEELPGGGLAPKWLYQAPGMALSTGGGYVHTERLMERIMADTGEPVGLLVVDTVAASFGGGDENSAKDMNLFLANLARLQTRWPDLAVLLLHHPTKESGPHEFHSGRGSGALRGTAQVEMAVRKVKDRPEWVEIGRTKSRDGRASSSEAFFAGKVVPVELRGRDGLPLRTPEGPMTTVVLEPVSAEDREAAAMDTAARVVEVREELRDLWLRMLAENGGRGVNRDAVLKRARDRAGADRIDGVPGGDDARSLMTEIREWMEADGLIETVAHTRPVVLTEAGRRLMDVERGES